MTDQAMIDQVTSLVQENRRLRAKSNADDETIHLLKEQYATVAGGIEGMVEDHRRRERELMIESHQHKVAYEEIRGLLNQAGDLLLQAFRARVGNETPEQMPQLRLPVIEDRRLPAAMLG